MTQKKEQNKQKSAKKSIDNRTKDFRFSPDGKIIVWVVSRYPIGLPDRAEMYGIFSTPLKASRAAQGLDASLHDVKIETYEVDYRTDKPDIKYWKPETKSHYDTLGE